MILRQSPLLQGKFDQKEAQHLQWLISNSSSIVLATRILGQVCKVEAFQIISWVSRASKTSGLNALARGREVISGQSTDINLNKILDNKHLQYNMHVIRH